MIDRGDHVVVIGDAPGSVDRADEVLPAAGGAARIRLDDDVALRREVLVAEIVAVADLPDRAAMDLQDRRVAPACDEARRLGDERLDLRCRPALANSIFSLLPTAMLRTNAPLMSLSLRGCPRVKE